MKSTVAKYNALLVALILVVAVASIGFNYHLNYTNRVSHARQILGGVVSHHVLQHLRELKERGEEASAERLSEILHESLFNISGMTTFGAVIGADKRVVGGVGVTDDARRALEAVDISTSSTQTLVESGSYIMVPVATVGAYRVAAGLDKNGIARDLWPLVVNTSLFVAAALTIYFMLAFTALRYWIVHPLKRFLESRLRNSIDSILTGNPPAEMPAGRLDMLPEDVSLNIEHNMKALHTWARHKANFDKFIAISTAENDKQQLASNLFNILCLELPIRNLTIFEINSSQNRFVKIYDALGFDYANDLMSNPQRCFVFRSGSRLVQLPGESVCASCRAEEGEVLICKPLVAAGKEMGVCKIVLDRERLIQDMADSGHGNAVAMAEAMLDTYIFLASLSLSNLTLLDSYKNQAITDGLTGLYNRRYIVEYMTGILNISKRGNTPVSVFMIDIDNFKRLNDEYGHNVGDSVLKAVATTMRRAIRDCDIIARYGGEEFVVVLPDTDSVMAAEVGERLCEAVAGIEWNDLDLGNIPRVTVSVGVAEFPLHGYSHYHLTNAADKALYNAKRSGKNRVVIHQSLPEEKAVAGGS